MEAEKNRNKRRIIIFALVFIGVNILSGFLIAGKEASDIDKLMTSETRNVKEEFQNVLDNYKHSFKLFAQMMTYEIEKNPEPDAIWDYLKSIDKDMLKIEGETFDGLYMYYEGRYLYSWDTPYSEYEETRYDATERPWYKAAVQGQGEIVFTPPYMSYANDYILTTLSQLQPDGKTVFAYDIKMGDIQTLVSELDKYDMEQIIFFDKEGTVIGSTVEEYLGGSLYESKEQTDCSGLFSKFREDFNDGLKRLMENKQETVRVSIGKDSYYGYLFDDGEFNFLFLVPVKSMLSATAGGWLVSFLIIELLLIYTLGTVSRGLKNHDLKTAYIELGQTQKRLEIALSAAQKAAAVDELTGMMNLKSFRKAVVSALDCMKEDESGIFLMIDGDHFKNINDEYGHNVGDEVIKLTAQMIIGRIRTVDIASRLHGDEFAIFIANSDDYTVAENIMRDINSSIAKEAQKRNMPYITVSSGAVIAKKGMGFTELSKASDEALYKAKETHNGGFAY